MSEALSALLVALHRALDPGAGERGSRAWRELTGLLRARSDEELATVLREAGASPGDAVRVGALAAALASHARADPDLAADLGRWAATATGPAGPAAPGGGTANTITAAPINGPVVQARDVLGGIHVVHQAPAQAPPAPRQLLPAPAHFTGRERDLHDLDLLRAGLPPGAPHLIVVSGPPGVGKTALVSHWLRGLGGEFPDGQFYADLRGHSPQGPELPAEVLGRFLRALGVAQVPPDLAEQAALWRTLTADRRVVVMLDNAVSAAQVRTLLPGAAGSLTVVTSRRRLTGLVTDGAVVHGLGLLEPNAAVELLTRSVGRDRIERELSAAREVAALCAFLPLAVCLAAARLASRPRQPVAAMVGILAREHGRLSALSADGEVAVQTALDESYRALPADAARLYRTLGPLPVVDFDRAVAAVTCPLPYDEADRVLDTLVEVNLLEDIGPDQYRFHDLIRLHARELAAAQESERGRAQALRRMLDWYLTTATRAEELLAPSHRRMRRDYACPPTLPPPFEAPADALAWLDTRRANLMASVRAAAAAGLHATAWQLVDAMFPLFLRLRPYDLWVEAYEIGLAAVRRAGDRAGENRMLTFGGGGLRGAGRPDAAADCYRKALEMAREDGNRRDESQALHGIGQCHQQAGRPEEARGYFLAALRLREGIGYRRGAALSRVCLGEIALSEDRPAEAIGHLARAHGELVAAGDRYDGGRALAFLGAAHARVGDHGAAERYLRRALARFRETGSVHWQARTYEMTGRAAQERGDTATAGRMYRRSLELYTPVSPSDTRRVADRLEAIAPSAAGPSA